MNLQELGSFKLSDAVTFHDELNPELWRNNHLRPEVKEQLLVIAQDFLEELGIDDVDVQDITVSGSNAAYSYTPHSDLDLHLLVDLSRFDDDIYKEFFHAKKSLYNEAHDIKIHGVPVEVYVQDSREPVVSLGEYSVLQDKWLRLPTKRRANFDQSSTKSKYETLLQLIQIALKSKDLKKVEKITNKIKQYRQAGLDKGGEFGPENLAYKILRSQGYITKLYDLRDKLHSEILTIETMYQDPIPKDNLKNKLAKQFKQYQLADEDYDPNGVPPGPEFKPTMPAGTVRVDVSDVYDWYKLGQHISDLEHTDPNMFGKGPPSTIMAFGSEPEEHKYINRLKKLGLTTTDIDPIDKNQPLGMPRQTVDPTYNVNETSEEEIHNYTKLDKILKKLCEMVVKGQKSDKDYGMVAACVLDPNDNIVAGLNSPGTDSKRVHAERVAIEKYEQKYGEVPEGSIVITTLSPCNEHDDETAADRVGESCAEYINSKGIEKVYCGYIDPTQDNDIRNFNLLETSDKSIREECKKFADTFLKLDEAPLQFAAEKTPDISPYAGVKDNQFRGGIYEGFDQPYPLIWEKSEHGDVDALAKLPDGTPLSIMFNTEQNNDGEEVVQVEFYRNNSQEVTGEGDAMRVFATVLTAIQQYVKKYKPAKLFFSASKDNWAKQQQNSESRAKLYDRLVQRYSKSWGYRAFRADNGDLVMYELSRIKKPVAEASGYIPSEKEKNDPRFKTALTVDVKPDSIKKNAKSFYWNTSRAGIPPTASTNGKF